MAQARTLCSSRQQLGVQLLGAGRPDGAVQQSQPRCPFLQQRLHGPCCRAHRRQDVVEGLELHQAVVLPAGAAGCQESC